MPIVTQKDYVILDEKAIQTALRRYVKETYNRDVDGKFKVETLTERDFSQSYKAKADLLPEK